MQKFTVGLLSTLAVGVFVTSPVSASVMKVMMAAPAKKADAKKAAPKKADAKKKDSQKTIASKEKTPTKASVKQADKAKPQAKSAITKVDSKTSAQAKDKKSNAKPKEKETIAKNSRDTSKKTAVKHEKAQQPKTVTAKHNAPATHDHTTAKKVTPAKATTYAWSQPAPQKTYTPPTKPSWTSTNANSAFAKTSPTLTYNQSAPTASTQSASVTPPISSFGKRNSLPTTFNVSAIAPAPAQKPIYVSETPNGPETRAKAVLVFDEGKLQILYERNSTSSMSMASITKLMTALVVVESNQDMRQILEISEQDIDHLKGTGSRLKIGTRLSRAEMLHLALMSSENRAASALGRYYPGGREAFVNAMNIKAAVLGMTNTHYVDTNGLSPKNVSCARDLAKLVMAAAEHPLIRKYSTAEYHTVWDGEKSLNYGSTNRLTHSSDWKIQVQKTGYIREAGQCLVMKTTIGSRPIVMVLLNVVGPKGARIVDAQQIKNWLTHNTPRSSSTFSRPTPTRSTSFSDDDFYN